jgi:hypothetical protein
MNGSKRSSAMLQSTATGEPSPPSEQRWSRCCHACPLKNSYLFRLAATVSELDGPRRNRSHNHQPSLAQSPAKPIRTRLGLTRKPCRSTIIIPKLEH